MTIEERRAARANIPVAKFRLGEEPPDDWVNNMPAQKRFEMVWWLSARLFEFKGAVVPIYARSNIPVRVTRLYER